MFITLVIFGIVMLVLAAALAGFVYVQIKARLIWRLLSIAVVLVVSCWYCSWSVHDRIDNLYSEHYGRGCGEFVEAIDKLTLEAVSYTHLRAHETDSYLVCRLLLEKKKK